MSDPEVWNVLLVDDEEDVHGVTQLALRRRKWRGRSFRLTSAYSAAQARELLRSNAGTTFQVALVDVVMETPTAGLELCQHIRQNLPSSLRIILRTGQPGAAPEEQVINDYDIDYYLAKPEVTADRLFSTIRACLRSSQDIETLLAFGRQLRSFTSALQTVSSSDDLLIFMNEGLKFLELKHSTRIRFVRDINGTDNDDEALRALVARAHEHSFPSSSLRPGEEIGGESAHVLPFTVEVEGSDAAVHGGFVVDHRPGDKMSLSLEGDLVLFMQNWRIAYGALLLQQRVAREKLLKEQMYIERMQSIASMVTGVAHEINTPLGVATTANSMMNSLMSELGATNAPADLLADIREASELLGKNLERASKLVRSFKQLSANQLSDDRATLDLVAVVNDCLDTMRPETRKRQLEVKLEAPETPMQWTGYPGHLSQVLINMLQNTMRYAYGDEGGKLDIRIRETTLEGLAGAKAYRIEVEDYGRGVAPEILARLFEPFVTSGRDRGGTGLGLAITKNIMTNLLKGSIVCSTQQGKGTRFDLVFPAVVPPAPTALGEQAT